MAKRVAILFSGQGAQQVGMGKDLAQHYASAANTYAEADRALGRSISQISFEGPIEQLTKTSNCQPALYVHGLAVWSILKEENISVVAAAGLSLGELTAHAAVGSFDFSTGLQLVADRSRFMEAACADTSGAMAAFIGGDEAAVDALADANDVDVANLNAPGQIVLSGSISGIEAAVTEAKQHGIKRAVRLQVGGAFHSRLMADARDQLRAKLDIAQIQRPAIPVISNFTARPAEHPDQIRETLTSQVTGTVRWTETIQYLVDVLDCELFLELGPGTVIAGLVKRIKPDVPVISLEDLESVQSAIQAKTWA